MTVPQTADVVIVGAGISGASAAEKILAADPNLTVVILELAHKGNGSTTRSAAAFRHQFSSRINMEMSLFSGREYAAFEERFGVGGAFAQNGYLFAYWDEDAMAGARERAAHQAESGVPDVEVLDPAEVMERFDFFDPDGLAGATFCRHDGFVYPDLIMDTYLDQAQAKGATLFQRNGLAGIEVEGGKVVGVTTTKGDRIATSCVVNAAGPWARHVGRLANADLPLYPIKRYLYFTNQMKEREITSYPLIVLDLEVYFRPEHNGFMIGWDRKPTKAEGWNAFPPPEVPADSLNDEIDPGFGTGIDGYGMETLIQVAERIPYFAEEVGIDTVTCGYYIITPDEKAIIDRDPRVEGLIHAIGFSGHGVMHAPATGQIVTDLALGRESSFALEGLALEPLLNNEKRDDPEKMVI